MNAFLIVIPIIFIRYGLLSIISKEALKRASFFAPVIGREKVAYYIYQIITTIILLYLLLLKIRVDSDWLFYGGLIIYSLGIILYAVSIINYAHPKICGINSSGLYQISRNPMYIAYLIYLLECIFLTHSRILFGLLIVFQISAHWIILSEERWCIKEFGEVYIKYMNKVKRYI